jgi:putative DNA primase/helicase
MTTAELIERLEGVKRQAGGWVAICPAHDDRHASLSIKEAGDDLLIKCHAGCAFDAILGAVPVPPRAERVVEATYHYRDADGTHLFDVIRYRPKDFRQRRADGAWALEGIRRVPYRLPELLTSKKGVVVVEGERDVDRLAALGIIATCNPGGAGKWRREYAEYLRGPGSRCWRSPTRPVDRGRLEPEQPRSSSTPIARTTTRSASGCWPTPVSCSTARSTTVSPRRR